VNWARVNRTNKCPVCGHDSWCVYNETVVLCMRVGSDRPFTSKSGETGWVHKMNGAPRVMPKREFKPAPAINCKRLIEDWSTQTRSEQLEAFASQLGITGKTLRWLNCCWSTPYKAWAFPMRDGTGGYVGIRLRTESGAKFAVPGSHPGLFYNPELLHGTIVVAEGPTDTAAAEDLGYRAVGRPSCSGGLAEIKQLCQTHWFRRLVIISDNDAPGLAGADMLQRHLQVPSCVLVLPCKDLREFVRMGGTKATLDSMISTAIWNQSE
jgi:hypothetical protein